MGHPWIPDALECTLQQYTSWKECSLPLHTVTCRKTNTHRHQGTDTRGAFSVVGILHARAQPMRSGQWRSVLSLLNELTLSPDGFSWRYFPGLPRPAGARLLCYQLSKPHAPVMADSHQCLSSPSDGVCTVVCLEAAPLPGLSAAPDVKELSLFGLPSTLLGKQLNPNKHVWSLSE